MKEQYGCCPECGAEVKIEREFIQGGVGYIAYECGHTEWIA